MGDALDASCKSTNEGNFQVNFVSALGAQIFDPSLLCRVGSGFPISGTEKNNATFAEKQKIKNH